MKENVSEIEKVYLSNVKAEEMIKSEIAVNPEFLNLKIGSESSDELVIRQALQKREELKLFYKMAGSNINPLVLIQLPDKKSDLINKKDDVLKILKDHKVNEENGKLAIWLSEEKTDTLVNIDKNDNEVIALIFKQAIALGWDCPRASILVIFRESKSIVFTIQTIGRIMRMPQLKYYSEPELNKGFIFTNLATINIAEDYAKNYITVYEAKRDNSIYKTVKFPSIYLKRQRARTRLSGEFGKMLLRVAQEFKLHEKLNLSPSKISNPIIADGRIVNVDQSGEIEHKGKIEVELNSAELQQRFDRFIINNCSPYAPVDSSDRMKRAIYQFLFVKFQISKLSEKAQRIVLGTDNFQAFADCINIAKERYKREVVEPLKEVREKIDIPNWEVPVLISYNDKYHKQDEPKSIMKPFYVRKHSEPERLFIESLEKSKKINWWFKNGESEIKYFAVLRSDKEGAFYPDFIVQFNDSQIGIFDTKAGRTASTTSAGPRAEGLQKYIKEQNKKEKRFFGGIVINTRGTWRINDNEKYVYDENNLSSWKILEL